MAKYVIEDTTLTGIADAIRGKTGGTAPIPVTDMATQIAAITGGTSEETVTTVLEEQTLDFAYNSAFGAYAFSAGQLFALIDGAEYHVVWDGVAYTSTAFSYTAADGASCIAVGNTLAAGGENNGDLYAVVYDATNQYNHLLSLEPAESHTVAIYKKALGGGSVEGIVYVTFMNGDVELCKTACMKGDSTVDPVADGKIAVPTKDPTNTVVYTHSGWALTDGGQADVLALVDVTEDRTVYAAYTESTRLYTINFLDGDTLLESQQVSYGGMPCPATPEKADYSFLGWEPELAAVTGDTNYASVWTSAAITFADSSWDVISAVCEAGNAENHFAVGDTRTFTGADGNEYTMRIIGLNVDPKNDGSGYAGITFAIVDAAKGSAYTVANWNTGFNTFVSTKLPDDLSAVLKSVNKKTYYKSSSSGTGSYDLSEYNSITTWQPSYLECGMLLNNMNATQEGLKVAAYPGLATQEARAALGTSFWTRTTERSSATYRYCFTASGSSNWAPTTNTTTTVSYIVCGCI